MGEWLSGKGVSFRCVTYTPVEDEVVQSLAQKLGDNGRIAADIRC